jgi:mannose-1-phosphate guanylyltransferase
LNAIRHRLGRPFLVSNSDVFADVALTQVLAAHEKRGAPMTVVVTRQSVNITYGVIDVVDGLASDFREKPTEVFSVSTGIYCMEPSVFDYIPSSGPFGFDQLMRSMLDNNAPVNVYEHDGRWVDIGRIEDLRRAQESAASTLEGQT